MGFFFLFSFDAPVPLASSEDASPLKRFFTSCLSLRPTVIVPSFSSADAAITKFMSSVGTHVRRKIFPGESLDFEFVVVASSLSQVASRKSQVSRKLSQMKLSSLRGRARHLVQPGLTSALYDTSVTHNPNPPEMSIEIQYRSLGRAGTVLAPTISVFSLKSEGKVADDVKPTAESLISTLLVLSR